MVTIYLVTSGEYSSYSVDGVFSSDQGAKDFIEKAGKGEVQPWRLDERCQDEVCSYWKCVLDLATGSLIPGASGSNLIHPDKQENFVGHADYICEAHPKGFTYSQSYVSQEHANKLCVEKKQEIQRQPKGVY